MRWPQKLTKKLLFELAAVGTAILAFLIYKLRYLSFRYGDQNIYFYYAQEILKGHVPHRDFFVNDPGLFIYLLAAFRFLIGQHWLWMGMLTILLHIAIALMIYLLLRRFKSPLSFLGPFFYLFSFSTLANSDYATGEELMIFFVMLAIWSWDNKKSVKSGAAWALAGLSKLYAGAGLIGFMVGSFFAGERKRLPFLIAGGLSVSLIWLIPFFLLSPNNFFYDLVVVHLNRVAGLDKANIFSYFIQREWLIIILAIPGFALIRKNLALAPFLGFLVFFIFFRDFYYLYFQALVPFLVIASIIFLGWLWENFPGHRIYSSLLLIVCFLFFVVSIYFYHQNWLNKLKFSNAPEVAEAVAKLPDSFPLYGAFDSTPLISLLSGRPIFKNYYDTNPIFFWTGRLDKEKIGREAADNGIYLVTEEINLPDLGIIDPGYKEFFSEKIFKSACRKALVADKLTIYRCKE